MDAEPGKFNRLKMVKYTDFGIYLDGGSKGQILMPAKYLERRYEVGEEVDCFVYFDTEDRLIATKENPLALAGECAYLECVAVSKFGAFMNWGLTKDLLVPFKEQKAEMIKGKFYCVYVFIDELSGRIVGSCRLQKHLNHVPVWFHEGDEVDLFIGPKTDLGYLAVIGNTHTGLLYENEIFQEIKPGDKLKGFIKKIRPDGKTDLGLQRPGFDALIEGEEEFLNILNKNDGFISLTDKSDPEEIYSVFKMSKKNWKKMVGHLYKNQRISILENGIKLLP